MNLTFYHRSCKIILFALSFCFFNPNAKQYGEIYNNIESKLYNAKFYLYLFKKLMTITLPNCPIHTNIDKQTYQQTNNNVANLMICFVYEIDKIWPKYILLNNVKNIIFHKKIFKVAHKE